MKVVIFAGGIGTRISEESALKPKPMIEIGGKPIIWHILKLYEFHGFHEFIICLGYKGYQIKEYFLNYFIHNANLTIDLKNNTHEIHQSSSESFKITLVDTGLETKTAGRLQRIKDFIGNETFMLTYGDGVSNINLQDLLAFHKSHGKYATVTSIQPGGKFGSLDILHDNTVSRFFEKPKGDGYWINAGFFVLEPQIFNYIKADGDHMMWEDYPLENLAIDNQLVAFKHSGFWKCMDALRDKIELEELWKTNKAEWAVWK
ncbi:MAG TPA: glucose-1-phosphate cytidylyltransferase [Cytophagaceae bacterium]|jgi:glucose-1-phosphate cytidylyltransferase|nr:glucose-1-phosphate cytidylyltransferase [Cytophagaceae bacterium]